MSRDIGSVHKPAPRDSRSVHLGGPQAQRWLDSRVIHKAARQMGPRSVQEYEHLKLARIFARKLPTLFGEREHARIRAGANACDVFGN
jgi:hypothetical protein